MKLPTLDKNMNRKGDKELPPQFTESYRPDLIQRAVLALQSSARQRYGAKTLAGMRSSSRVSKRRRNWRGCYGFGISRVNRKILSRRGTRMHWVGAFTPQTVGGRRAHPPKAERIWGQKINDKERRKAIRSAMAATLSKELVQKRGHHLPQQYPFLIDSSIEQLQKTQDVQELLLKLGFAKELERSAIRKVRAGIGKLRGRKYRRKKGLLIVVAEECPLVEAGKNIPGVDIVLAKALNAEVLAPGAHGGRVALWTEHAVELIGKENLFV